MICDPTSLKNSKWSTDEEVEFPKTVLQCNTRHVQARPNLVPTPHHAFIPRPPYTPPIPTHIHVPRHCASVSPHVKRKGVEDSHGFWIPRRGFRIPSTGFRIFCQCSVDSRFQSLMDSGFLDLYSGFKSPGFRIPQAKFPEFWNPHFLTWANCLCSAAREPGLKTSRYLMWILEFVWSS